MNINRLFPIWLHIIFAASAIGLAVGMNHAVLIDVVKAYTATGFAVGLGVSAILRFFGELM